MNDKSATDSLYLKAAYVAHPLNAASHGERMRNIELAEMWARFLASLEVVPLMPWGALARGWSEKLGRELGLRIDFETINRCDALVLCGPSGCTQTSSGMRAERDHALDKGKQVIDLTGYDRDVATARVVLLSLGLTLGCELERCWNCDRRMIACDICGSSGIIRKPLEQAS